MHAGPSQGMPIIRSLCRSPCRRCSQRCFIATNSEPNELDLQPVCFFDNQQTGAQLCTKNPVLNHLVTALAVWSASTFASITNPSPRGSGMSGGSSSFPCCRCPNSLHVQSFSSKADLLRTGSLGSCTISALWCFFKHAKT
jgi:hypothetical protein